jgi:inner membrane protein
VVAAPTRRARALVAMSGVLADADGVGLLIDLATRDSAQPTSYWAEWHHVMGHGACFALVVSLGCAALAHEHRLRVALLSLLTFHLHILGDLVGAGGPDGEQ